MKRSARIRIARELTAVAKELSELEHIRSAALRENSPIHDLPFDKAAIVLQVADKERSVQKAIRDLLRTLTPIQQWFETFRRDTGLRSIGTLTDIESLKGFLSSRTGLMKRRNLKEEDIVDAYAEAVLRELA
jgi:hypothetical protein